MLLCFDGSDDAGAAIRKVGEYWRRERLWC